MSHEKFRTLLVDDEKPARARLARMLAHFPEIEIVGEAQDGISALSLIADQKPDLLFLDIEMPELDGFGVARSLGPSGPTVIFVTAYDEHALKAFDAGAIDYLVKPVAELRLKTAIERLIRRAGKESAPLDGVLQQMGQNREARFAVRSGAKFVICDPKKISAIVARDHYAAILSEGRELLSDDSLEVFEKRLNPAHFVRVHRSAIINLDFLQELEREGDRKYLAVLSDAQKTKVPISRERLDEVKSKLGIS